MDLFYPVLAAQLGGYTLRTGIRITVCSARDIPSDWATVRFTRQMPAAITLKRDDPARIYLGYAGALTQVFEGTVAQDFSLSGQLNEVLLKDGAVRLARTVINHTFVTATPQEVVRYCCRQAGIALVRTSDVGYPQMTYPAIGVSALEAIRGINHHWGIRVTGVMQNGAFEWNVQSPQETAPLFEYGKNIVSLAKEAGCWVLVTVSVPQLRHSQRIAVSHPLVSGQFEVDKVVFTSSEDGFIRTKIYFRG